MHHFTVFSSVRAINYLLFTAYCRKNFLIAWVLGHYGDGVYMSGFTVQLITLGLLKVSLLST